MSSRVIEVRRPIRILNARDLARSSIICQCGRSPEWVDHAADAPAAIGESVADRPGRDS